MILTITVNKGIKPQVFLIAGYCGNNIEPLMAAELIGSEELIKLIALMESINNQFFIGNN